MDEVAGRDCVDCPDNAASQQQRTADFFDGRYVDCRFVPPLLGVIDLYTDGLLGLWCSLGRCRLEIFRWHPAAGADDRRVIQLVAAFCAKHRQLPLGDGPPEVIRGGAADDGDQIDNHADKQEAAGEKVQDTHTGPAQIKLVSAGQPQKDAQ